MGFNLMIQKVLKNRLHCDVISSVIFLRELAVVLVSNGVEF